MSRRLLSLGAAATLSMLAGSALAQDPAPAAVEPNAPAPAGEAVEGFGKAGVINIASDLTFSIQHTSFKAPAGGTNPDSTTSYSIGPAADYFVIDNLSLGALLLFSKTSVGTGSANTIAFTPRVGYHIPLVPGSLGLWPRLEFGYASTTFKTTGAPDQTEKRTSLGVFVPLLIHPVEHFHIGIGPFFDTDLSAKDAGQDGVKETTLGLETEIGGWWLL
jgi:hypothetical protein